METLEGFKDNFGKLWVKSDAIVFNDNLADPLAGHPAMNPDRGNSIITEFQGVSDQILKELSHLAFFGLDHRQFLNGNLTACFFEDNLKDIRRFPCYVSQSYLLKWLFLAGYPGEG
jgi:hypothetical protein